MASWSRRRKNIYAVIVAAFLIAAIGLPAFFLLYEAPTCFDGIRNGREQDVDCGGSCERLCSSSFLPPQVVWTRYEKIAPGIYNMAAYIVNPNTDAEARNVPYSMIMYDKDGIPITEVKGSVTIPPHRNTLAFRGSIDVDQSIPVSRVFAFTATPEWTKREDPLKFLTYNAGTYSEDEAGSYFAVLLNNSSLEPIKRVAVYVVLKDRDQNVVGFSKTIVDEIPPKGSAIAPFTWPKGRQGEVISQEVLPVAE